MATPRWDREGREPAEILNGANGVDTPTTARGSRLN